MLPRFLQRDDPVRIQRSPDAGYRLLDSGRQCKLEQFGEYVLQRPCAQAVWSPLKERLWSEADAVFRRDTSGTGNWKTQRKIPEHWEIDFAELRWEIRPNHFGNVGIFAEQEGCWSWLRQTAASLGVPKQEIEVLNLFGYTGGSSLQLAREGVRVVHLDASKTSIGQARTNAELSSLQEAPIRWITDDAVKFVQREQRRDRRYTGIVLDPPTFGRGTRGETWKIDEDILSLLSACVQILDSERGFLLLTSHSPGYTPLVLENLLSSMFEDMGVTHTGKLDSGEMVICEEETGRPLPSGAFAGWSAQPSATEVPRGHDPR